MYDTWYVLFYLFMYQSSEYAVPYKTDLKTVTGENKDIKYAGIPDFYVGSAIY